MDWPHAGMSSPNSPSRRCEKIVKGMNVHSNFCNHASLFEVRFEASRNKCWESANTSFDRSILA